MHGRMKKAGPVFMPPIAVVGPVTGSVEESEMLLIHYPQYRALACRTCKYALNPGSGVVMQLRELHKSIDLRSGRKLIAHTNELDFIKREAIVVPRRGGAAIDGLSRLDGFECRECGHLCSSEVSMIEHGRKAHGLGTANGERWDECTIQTFLPKNRRGYFIATRQAGSGGECFFGRPPYYRDVG